MAAGEGTRMKSRLPKVLHKICGRAMIEHVIEAAKGVSTEDPVIVIGHGRDKIRDYLGQSVRYAVQEEQKGTGHAVMMARDYLENQEGYVVILAGDMPLITKETLSGLVQYTIANDLAGTALTAVVDDPTGYGRILRNDEGNVIGIVEHKDATEEQKKIREINASIYCFDIPALLRGLQDLKNENAQGEYYLTDIIGIFVQNGLRVGAYVVPDATETQGVNNRAQLAEAEADIRQRICRRHMINGVTIVDPFHTYIEDGVTIERDVVIYPGNVLEGKTHIAEGTILYPNNRIQDSIIGENVQIENSVILASEVGENTTVGPFAYLRPGTKISRNA